MDLLKGLLIGALIEEELIEERHRTTTCKKCKKIFSEGYPYKKSIFGKVKSYVCKDCAKTLGLIQ